MPVAVGVDVEDQQVGDTVGIVAVGAFGHVAVGLLTGGGVHGVAETVAVLVGVEDGLDAFVDLLVAVVVDLVADFEVAGEGCASASLQSPPSSESLGGLAGSTTRSSSPTMPSST